MIAAHEMGIYPPEREALGVVAIGLELVAGDARNSVAIGVQVGLYLDADLGSKRSQATAATTGDSR
ncbi:MAG: hypothetical protein ACRDRO_06925 [Pseudonocardiaceae bacterium]